MKILICDGLNFFNVIPTSMIRGLTVDKKAIDYIERVDIGFSFNVFLKYSANNYLSGERTPAKFALLGYNGIHSFTCTNLFVKYEAKSNKMTQIRNNKSSKIFTSNM